MTSVVQEALDTVKNLDEQAALLEAVKDAWTKLDLDDVDTHLKYLSSLETAEQNFAPAASTATDSAAAAPPPAIPEGPAVTSSEVKQPEEAKPVVTAAAKPVITKKKVKKVQKETTNDEDDGFDQEEQDDDLDFDPNNPDAGMEDDEAEVEDELEEDKGDDAEDDDFAEDKHIEEEEDDEDEEKKQYKKRTKVRRHKSLAEFAQQLLGLEPNFVAENIRMFSQITTPKNTLADGSPFNLAEEAGKLMGGTYTTVDQVLAGAR